MTDIVDVLIQRPCHVCGGDCSAANPPVNYCPKDEDVKAANEIKRLRAEVAALKNDAERYRWLRSSFRVARWDVKYWTGEFWDVMYGDAMDKQIDAALGGEGR